MSESPAPDPTDAPASGPVPTPEDAAVPTASPEVPASTDAASAPEPDAGGADAPADGTVPPVQVPSEAAAGALDLGAVTESLTDLRASVDRLGAALAARDEQIRLLQARVDELRGDQIRALLGPALSSFVTLLTKCQELEHLAREAGQDSADDFEYFEEMIADALGELGVESVAARPGESFDRRRHQAIKRQDTPEQALDGTIARVSRQGLIRTGEERAFIPASVVVRRFNPDLVPAPQAEDAATDQDGEIAGHDQTTSTDSPAAAGAN